MLEHRESGDDDEHPRNGERRPKPRRHAGAFPHGADGATLPRECHHATGATRRIVASRHSFPQVTPRGVAKGLSVRLAPPPPNPPGSSSENGGYPGFSVDTELGFCSYGRPPRGLAYTDGMPTENKRRFAGNDVRRDAAMTLAHRIEQRANRGQPAHTQVTCSVRDDGGTGHTIFVDQRENGSGRTTNLATVSVYAPGKARAHGTYSNQSAIVESLEWFKKNVTG